MVFVWRRRNKKKEKRKKKSCHLLPSSFSFLLLSPSLWISEAACAVRFLGSSIVHFLVGLLLPLADSFLLLLLL